MMRILAYRAKEDVWCDVYIMCTVCQFRHSWALSNDTHALTHERLVCEVIELHGAQQQQQHAFGVCCVHMQMWSVPL